MIGNKPVYKHYCEECQFIRTITYGNTTYDVYICGNTIIMRYGDDGPAYASTDMETLIFAVLGDSNAILARTLTRLINDQTKGEIVVDTMEMIQQGYTQVADGMKRIDLENKDGVKVTVYRMGDMIRIDVKEPEKKPW